ncbi:MAG: glycosyltransferase family 4 protein [Actinomycetota bacterium]
MITVAVDSGPLHGSMTGVGRAVDGILQEFATRPSEISVIPYLVSRRAPLRPGSRRLPYPAAVAMRAWAHWDHPTVDRLVRPARVIHGTNYVVPPARIPRVVSVYDTWALRNPESCSAVVNRAMAVLRRNIRTGAIVHASSRATADDVRAIFPSAPVRVVHLGSPPPKGLDSSPSQVRDRVLPSLIGSDSPYVLSVGTIERRKNFPRLIDAFTRTAAAQSGIRLVIAGSPGDDMEDVRSAIDSLGMHRKTSVILLGRVSESSLDLLYEHAEMLAYPSLDEGFGFPILEAMSHGVPVLGSDRGSIPEIAGTAAVLVDPIDLDAMAGALDRLLADSSLRESLRANGFNRCEQFTWKRTADGLIDLYSAVASGGDVS